MCDFIYDLTSCENAIDSLSKLVHIESVDIKKFLWDHFQIDDLNNLKEDFISKFNIDMNEVNIENLCLKSVQVTTNNDNCESIKRYGLLNTQEAIKKETYISQYLVNKGIKINFEEESIEYKGKKYYKRERNSGDIQLCFTKLFSQCHFPINAFIYSDNPLKYGENICEKPEIIRDLAKAFNNDIEKDWIKNTKCFKIEFKASICDYQDDIFEGYERNIQVNKELAIKEWLIDISLNLINELMFTCGHSDIYAYMNPNYLVNPQNIIGIISIDK